MLIALTMSLGARAAISEGPKPIDAYEEKKRNNALLFEANQLYQEQLRAEQELYQQMQTTGPKSSPAWRRNFKPDNRLG